MFFIKKLVLKTLLGAVIIEVILICLFILIGDWNMLAAKTLGTVALIFLYSIPCVFYSELYDKHNYQTVAVVATLTACGAAFLNILSIWSDIDYGVLHTKLYFTLNISMWMFIFLSILLPVYRDNNMFKAFRKFSIGSLISLTSLFTLFIWAEYFPQDFGARLVAVLTILTAGSFIATMILTKIYKP